MNVEGNIPTSAILRVFSIAEVESEAECAIVGVTTRTGFACRIGTVIITVRWIRSSVRAVAVASPIYQGLSR